MFTLSNELYYDHLPAVPTNDVVVAASTTAAAADASSTASAPVCCFTESSSVHANLNMDSVFFMGEGDRSTFLHTMMQFFGSTYICLWSYDQSNLSQPLFNFLRYMDGLYRERSSDQLSTSSSSSGSLAQVRFNEYRQSLFVVDHNRFVPGYALVNNIPYLELKSDDLLKLVRAEAQRQFYQAAGIKTAVFMGCNAGEIELGFSGPSQVNIEKEMRNWFPDDFSRQLMLMATTATTMKIHDQQNKPASSSSSLRSLSYDSPEYPPPPPNFIDQQEPIVDQHLAAGALKPSPSIFTTGSPHQSLISQIRSPQIPSIESEDDAMAKAILAVICSNNNNNPNITINSNTFHFQPQQNFPINTSITTTRGGGRGRGRESAFKWYGSASSSSSTASLLPKSSTSFRRQNMIKRSIAFLRSIHTMRSHSQQEHNTIQGRTSSTQLHHMISERRRREKLNESFQALRSLLPPGTKKDKASVLTGTTEYLSSLKAEVAEIRKRNAILEAQILRKKTAAGGGEGEGEGEVGITEVSELATTSSSTGTRLIDLHVRIGETNITDLLVSLLEFLKTSSDHHHHHQISLMSVEANTTSDESSNSVNLIVFRLKIEGEWDESGFQEAVRRIVNNQTPQ